MRQDELLALYKRVQQRDRNAEETLRALHAKAYPQSPLNKEKPGESPYYRETLHAMYSHLYRRAGQNNPPAPRSDPR